MTSDVSVQLPETGKEQLMCFCGDLDLSKLYKNVFMAS